MLTRRTLLAGVTPGAALVVAGCTSTQQANFAVQWANFINQVQDIASRGCTTAQGVLVAIIPTANTIEAVVAALYPAAVPAIAAVNAGTVAVTAVVNAVCSAIPPNPPASLVRKLRGAVRGVTPPVFVNNVVVNGQVVPIVGYGH